MNKTNLWLLFFINCFIVFILGKADNKALETEFYNCMNNSSHDYIAKYSNTRNKKGLEVLKDLYIKNNLKDVQKLQQNKIPKIIHQIWVGPNPIPHFFKAFKESWIEQHPGWKYKLWTNEDVKKLNLVNRALYDHVSHPREKANIVRYEILLQEGGLYVDGDFLCLKSFDELSCYDFYVGISANDAKAIINNGLIAAAPGHPIMRQIVHNINPKIPKRASRSGVMYFSKEILNAIKKARGKNIAFPVNFFYSVPKTNISFNNKKDLFQFLTPQSMALHYWATSWNAKIEKLILSLKKNYKANKSNRGIQKSFINYLRDLNDEFIYDVG